MTDNPTPNEIALLREENPSNDYLRGYYAGRRDATSAILHFVEPIFDGAGHRLAALTPGQHYGAAGEGLTITDDEIDDAIAHGFGERFTERAQSATPKPSTEQARAEGERVRLLINQVEAGQFDELDAVADRWSETTGVQRMANAMASVFENHASQEIMDRFREKLAALMHLAFVEGAAQGVLQLRATPKPSTEQARAEGGQDEARALLARELPQQEWDQLRTAILSGSTAFRSDPVSWVIEAAVRAIAAATPSGADALGDRL